MAGKCTLSVSKYGTSDILVCSVHGQIREFSTEERNDTPEYQKAIKAETAIHLAAY